MTTLEIIFHVVEILGIFAFMMILKYYFPSYLSEKGKNLATKEDIAEITQKTEYVRSQFTKSIEALLQQNRLILEQYKSRNQMRLAALDRRLDAHQQAFSFWKKILSNVHDSDKIGTIVMECQEWWNKNCLYLDAEARESFWKCFNAAFNHRDLIDARADSNSIKENWANIIEAGETIVRCVSLPTIGELESKVLELNSDKKSA